jgi:uncharacterized protein (TIGR03067 family)
MRRLAVALALVGVALAAADDKASKSDLKALSGKWLAVGAEAKGKEVDKSELKVSFTFEASGKATFAHLEKGDEARYRFTIDPSKKPGTIDLVYEGPAAALKGTKQFGIYKVEKDKLTLCLSDPGGSEKDRPKKFAAKGEKVLLLRLERGK